MASTGTDRTTTLLILGASGDLTSRLLLPALGQLLRDQPHRSVHLQGAGMDDWDQTHWRDVVRDAFADGDAAHCFDRVASSTYRRADITQAADLRTLIDGAQGRVALYFAVPPAVAERAIDALADVDLPADTVLALEKPFGSDEASAQALNAKLAQLMPESQVFRVDHFLGHSTLLNMMGVRFANRVLEPAWSAEHVASVVIRYDETLGLEGRAGYYDGAGALVDMIQSHLLQVLAVTAMEPPATLGERDLRDATGAVLRATHVWNGDPVTFSRRGVYTAGTVDGRDLPNYTDEDGVDPGRKTETLAEVTLEVATQRWQGVPFTLRSGKAIGDPVHEVTITFHPVRHLPSGFTGSAPGSVLRFVLGPDTMSMELNRNGNEDPFELSRTTMSTDLGEGARKAYAEVVSGVLDGDPTLSVRGDAAQECWRIVQPVLDAWKADEVALQPYAAGSQGPQEWPTCGALPG